MKCLVQVLEPRGLHYLVSYRSEKYTVNWAFKAFFVSGVSGWWYDMEDAGKAALIGGSSFLIIIMIVCCYCCCCRTSPSRQGGIIVQPAVGMGPAVIATSNNTTVPMQPTPYYAWVTNATAVPLEWMPWVRELTGICSLQKAILSVYFIVGTRGKYSRKFWIGVCRKVREPWPNVRIKKAKADTLDKSRTPKMAPYSRDPNNG